jgi:hypothetical protein
VNYSGIPSGRVTPLALGPCAHGTMKINEIAQGALNSTRIMLSPTDTSVTRPIESKVDDS